jgi:preprotein translocase subunit SecA
VQSLVRLYARRSGMTGTLPAADEFQRLRMPVEVIPRHRPHRRVDLRRGRIAAPPRSMPRCWKRSGTRTPSRPVLVGTADVALGTIGALPAALCLMLR